MRFPIPAPKGGQLGSLWTVLHQMTSCQSRLGNLGLSSRIWSSPVLPYPQVSTILKLSSVMGERLMVAMSVA